MCPPPQHAPITPLGEVSYTSTSFFTPHMGNPPSNPIYLTTGVQSYRLGDTPSTSSTTMSTRNYPCKENGSVYQDPSWDITFDWDHIVQEQLPSSTLFQIRVTVNTFTIYQCIIDDGASSCIMSLSA
jgi:hypothetical protein